MAYRLRSTTSVDGGFDGDRYHTTTRTSSALGEIHHLNGSHHTLPYRASSTTINNGDIQQQQQQQQLQQQQKLQQQRYAQNADRYTTNRNGHWAGSYNGVNGDSSAVHLSNGVGSSQRGSQSALLSVKNDRHKWPKGKDFLFSTWAFTIAAHSLWELPVNVLKYGGVVFVIIYLIMFLILGTPLLLLEMTIGQYSGLAPTRLYRHICPILTGVGFAILASCLVHSLTDLAVITWCCQALYLLFTRQAYPDNFFLKKVLNVDEEIDLGNLGVLNGQLALCLGITCLVVFVFIAASTKSVGKVSMILVPCCYGLLMTLTIRGFMAEGGLEGVKILLRPNWSYMTSPWVWLEATKLVFITLQLGMGVISTYASFNKFHHNIIRDASIIAIGHFVWSILCILFVFSLLGVANSQERINLANLAEVESVVSITGKGFWLVGVTLAESALAALEFNWLWSGLLFTLIVLTSLATIMGTIETLSASVVDEYPTMKQYKPAIAFTFLAAVFMVNLVLATQGGIYVYYLLKAYYSVWPLILFGLLTVLTASYSHGGKYLMKDLGDMSKMPLSHYVNSHLSVLYSSVIPVFLIATLGWCLYGTAFEHITKPLQNFSMVLPEEWGMPLGWSLAIIPVFLILLGIVFHLMWKSRGIPFKMHLRRSCKPTDVWYENEHKELMQLESSPKESPLLAYKKGYDNGNITEV